MKGFLIIVALIFSQTVFAVASTSGPSPVNPVETALTDSTVKDSINPTSKTEVSQDSQKKKSPFTEEELMERQFKKTAFLVLGAFVMIGILFVVFRWKK